MPLSTNAQAIITDAISHWTCPNVHVIYSHDLQLERVAFKVGKQVTSAGITSYQGVVGNAFAEKFLFPLDDAYTLWAYPWWSDALWQSPITQAATLHVFHQFAHILDKTDIHHHRLLAAYAQQFPKNHQHAQSRLQDQPLRLTACIHSEPEEYLPHIPTDEGVILSLIAPDASHIALDKILKHKVKPLTDERIGLLGEMVTDFKEWLILSPDLLPAMKDHLKGMAKSDSGATLYFYSNSMSSRITLPRYKFSNRFFAPILDHPIESLSLVPIAGDDLNTLRAKYLAHGTPIGLRTQGTVSALAVVSGEYLLGAFGIAQRTPNYAHYRNLGVDAPVAFLTTDFAVHPTHYQRLGKLIIGAALTQEAKAWMEHSLGNLVQTVVTSAFSQNPVSMKYRGLFKLLRRIEGKDNNPYTLIYASAFRDWSLADALSWWQGQHGGTDAD